MFKRKKARIVKRIFPDGKIKYIIQQRYFIFFGWWVDVWINHDTSTTNSFSTLKEAQKHLCYFDGTKCVDIEVY